MITTTICHDNDCTKVKKKLETIKMKTYFMHALVEKEGEEGIIGFLL